MQTTLPNTFTPNSSIPTAQAVRDNLFAPWTGNESLHVVNGWLDLTNLDATKIPRQKVLPGTFVKTGQASSTHTSDYFKEAFQRYDVSADVDDDNPKGFQPIVGAQATFFLPRDPVAVLFSWNINWATDTDNNTYVTRMRFKENSTWQAAQIRESLRATFQVTLGGVPTSFFSANSYRQWSGHHLSESCSKGWNSAGLWLATEAAQAHVRVRAFRWFAFF
jgi:hypothetical protein